MVGSDNINLEIEKKEEKIFTPVSPHMKIDASRFSRDHDIEKEPQSGSQRPGLGQGSVTDRSCDLGQAFALSVCKDTGWLERSRFGIFMLNGVRDVLSWEKQDISGKTSEGVHLQSWGLKRQWYKRDDGLAPELLLQRHSPNILDRSLFSLPWRLPVLRTEAHVSPSLPKGEQPLRQGLLPWALVTGKLFLCGNNDSQDS